MDQAMRKLALQAAHAAGHDLMHLTVAEHATFDSIARRGCDRPCTWAQNLLCYGYQQCIPPCTGGNATQRALHPMDPAPDVPIDPLTVFPNPARSYTTLAYTITEALDGAWLIVRQVDGREVKRMVVNQPQGQALLDTRDFVPGTYSVELVNAGARLATERLVLKP